MQNPIQKFRQSSIVFEKPGILFENLKTQASSNYPTVQYFLLKLCTRLLLTNVYKRVRRIFLVCLVIESFAKIKNTWFLHTHFFNIFINNSRSKQNKKNLEHSLVDIIKQKRYAQFQQKILELVKVFNFSDKKPGFLEITDLHFNLGIRFCITWLVLPSYKGISP